MAGLQLQSELQLECSWILGHVSSSTEFAHIAYFLSSYADVVDLKRFIWDPEKSYNWFTQ